MIKNKSSLVFYLFYFFLGGGGGKGNSPKNSHILQVTNSYIILSAEIFQSDKLNNIMSNRAFLKIIYQTAFT